jgi:protein-disulfide isomerase
MKNLVLMVGALAIAACSPDTKNLEKKVDELNKKLDQLIANGGGGGNRGAVGAAAGAQPQRAQRPEPDRAKTYALPVDGDPFDGPADAKVTVVKAYDYACPYCEKVRDTMSALRQKYGNDVRVVYKQFVVHPQVATAGALAFCAAARQGKADQMDALLWDKSYKAHNFDKDADNNGQPQKCWDSSAGCPIVLGYASELQLNADKFKSDMKDCQQLVQKDMKDLQALGVGATPSFFINGRFIAGAMPIENFTQLIDEEIKKADAAIAAGTPKGEYYNQVVVGKGLKSLEAPKQ